MVEELAKIPLLILAGGKATRLQGIPGVGTDTPKYLMPLDATTCFADFHLNWAKAQGFKRIILSLGHLSEKIVAHCGTGERYGLEISYILDGDKPLGTGGAVALALKQDFEILAVTYGDTILNIQTSELLSTLKHAKTQVLMTVYLNNVPGHRSNCDFNGSVNGSIATYDKANPEPNWAYIDYGFFLMRRSVIQDFAKSIPLDLAEPISQLSRREQVFGVEIKDRFWEIGTPDSLVEFRKHFGFFSS